jgi:ubiquinone/menaquinone biosynthesis C-methylase UbiE
MTQKPAINVDSVVQDRYSEAAQTQVSALCCPVQYNQEYLKVIPQEVIERDYGCGDPSEYVKAGETVLDLGSGTGKICFIASQVVGSEGRVIGVDMNDTMLQVAREAAPVVAERIGFNNVEFYKGRIQDLQQNREALDRYLKEKPIQSELDYQKFEDYDRQLRQQSPLIADQSIDVVVSNCVLNLVETDQKGSLFREIHRVLKRGGRAVISDIVSDEAVPQHMQEDPELWSGCISGAFAERDFLRAFEQAGFYGVDVVKRDEKPWQTVEGIEFRSVTVIAYKGKEGECWDHNEALIYKGPFQSVRDDDGHVFVRGERIAVCRKTFEIFSREPYREHFYQVEPYAKVAAGDAQPFDCKGASPKRSPRETKGQDYRETSTGSGSSCC